MKKFHLYSLIIIFFILGCDQSNSPSGSTNSYGKTICIQEDNVQFRNGLIYLPNQKEPFTGENICAYLKNGQYSSKGKIKDGKLNGKWFGWYENGQKAAVAFYKEGMEHGEWFEWDENGQVAFEAQFNNGKCISGDC